ncbi:MAG: DUF87 domain-containing protein [Lachnospiraceae bacterium]|nr:DUF87 domain-containing protein [Lachnospiraceae bacterium]
MIRTRYEQTKVADTPLYSEPESAQEIFSIEAIDAGGIFCLPDGRFSKTYQLSDINFAGVTDEEQKALILSFGDVLKTLPCRFSYCIANEYVDEGEFLSKVLCKKKGDEDDPLRDDYNRIVEDKLSDARQGLYQSIYLTLTIKADDLKSARSEFLSIEGSMRTDFLGISQGTMQGSELKVLSIDERMDLIEGFFRNGIHGRIPFSFRDAALSGCDFTSFITPAAIEFDNERFIINGKYGKVFYVDEYPKMLESKILSELQKINCTGFITVNNELLEISAFKQEISRKYMSLGMKIEGEKQRNRSNNDFLSDASQKLLNEREKIDKFIRELDERDDHYFNTTILMAVLAKDEEELARIEKKIDSITAGRSYVMRSCFARQKEGLSSTLPFGIQEFKRVVNLSSSCLGMYMPFRTQEIFVKGGIYYGINQISQNAIVADRKKLKNHNGLIIGQSGTGKSTLIKTEIISIFLNHPMDQILVVDPQSEYGKVVRKMHGSVICFDDTKQLFINPMDVSFRDAEYSILRQIISEKSDFMITLVSSLLGRGLDPEEQGIIDKVIDKVYSDNFSLRKRLMGGSGKKSEFEVPPFMKAELPEDLPFEAMSDDEQVRRYSPMLLDVYQGLLEQGTEKAQGLAAAMEIFVNGSLNLFNHRTNVDLSGRLISFDLSGIKENLRVTGMLIMMETVRGKIRERSKEGRWTHLFIDEFHELLSVPQVAEFILKLWKEIRKMKGILSGITQNMSDILSEDNAGRLSAILSNTEYFAILSSSSLDKKKLIEFLPEISPAMFSYVENAPRGTGLLKFGEVTLPFDIRMSEESEIYKIVNTDGGGYGV